MTDRDLDRAAIEKLRGYADEHIDGLLDGIIDIESYAKAQPRILWVLKESIDYGDYRPLDELMKQNLSQKDGFGETYEMMGYVSHALMSSKDETWQSIPQTFYHDGQQGSGESLKHVAIINAKKMWGDSTSDVSEVVSGYRQHRDFIHAQVETYKPDVVIFGYCDDYNEIVSGIYRHAEGQELEAGRKDQDGSLSIFKGRKHQDRLYLWAYHPSYRKSEQAKSDYCMEIVRAYRKFRSTLETPTT